MVQHYFSAANIRYLIRGSILLLFLSYTPFLKAFSANNSTATNNDKRALTFFDESNFVGPRDVTITQCSPVALNTQSDVHNFSINYLNCTEVNVDLILSGTLINNFNGLSGITSIWGDLVIEGCGGLFELDGLENLISIGGDLLISENDNISNIDATEVPYNGINEDCDAATFDDDLDQDGFVLAQDCDDDNESINPNAIDIPNNGIDEDCDGNDLISSTTTISETTVSISPNPTKGEVQIQLSNHKRMRISLFNLTGQLVLNETGKGNVILDINKLTSGLYLIQVETDEEIWLEKLTKI